MTLEKLVKGLVYRSGRMRMTVELGYAKPVA